MNAIPTSTHPVVFPVGNTGPDNLAMALSLVTVAGIAVRSDADAGDVLKALDDVLDLAERFLAAGVAWARDPES